MQPTDTSDPSAQPRGATSFSGAKGKVLEMGQKASDLIDEKRGAAAEGLDSAAAALHEKADSLTRREKVANAAHTAADAVGSAADYVHDNDFKGMLADVQGIVKNNPGTALLTAAALGFLIARTFSRK